MPTELFTDDLDDWRFEIKRKDRDAGRKNSGSTDEGLALVLVGVSPSQEGVNKKFRALVESMTEQGNCVEHEQLSN